MQLTPNQLKWVEALESGEFAQTKGALQRWKANSFGDPVGFCCLGVACELAIRDGVELAPRETDHGTVVYGTYAYGTNEASLPWPVQQWLGILSHTGFDPRIGGVLASHLNDQHGLSFREIAAEIRKHGVR